MPSSGRWPGAAAADADVSERLVKITDTIYVGMPTSGADSNGWIFINDDDVLVVDNHWTPARAQTLLADIKSITAKPVRYVVDTHYHSDHAMGNQRSRTCS